ncbi:FAD-binding protein [Arcicella aquatica]|uniref:FAD-binding protein n=1 Tax=Arcicella aquatica TaxID=217141 RepID=A0ABU5QP90_9BACT|nr:FAD-binding protein [Arcicella aquatica]MEA5258828.1 FAD-binding protein [Arcicella aquatica]
MKKRTFLKTSSIMVGGIVLSRLVACKSAPKTHLKNWAENLEYSAENVYYPKNVEEVQEIVKKCDSLKALGSRHSFNTIADSSENQISLKDFNKVVSLDKKANTVTVEGGIQYGELAPYLEENGYALHNLASLPHISVVGACATATHGSGVKNGNLSTAVTAFEFVNAEGEVINLSKEKDGEKFNGAVVGLGALGVITKITLALQPSFKMKQVVYRNLPMSALEKNFETIMSSGYSVSLFTDWKNKNINEVWVKSKVEEDDATEIPAALFGAKLATQNLHPIEEISAENCTEQLGIPGVWYERMPHFKMGFTPSAGKELQSEYFVPIEHGYEAMMAIEKLHEKVSPHIFISEIRAIQADDLWMSPCYNQTCVAIHTTWKQEVDVVMGILPLFEEQLAPFNARPHWAKLFTMDATVLQGRIGKLNDFKALVKEYDPKGKFQNEFLKKNLS